LDEPLLYERGWAKKLTMIFAMTPWSIEHVTARYTADYNATVHRRGVTEDVLQEILGEVNHRLHSEVPVRSWGYDKGRASRNRSLDEIALWAHFDIAG